jgi:hypothetical protein
MTDKTDLQQAIEDAILGNQSADDKEIARIVYSTKHPGKEYKAKGCSPTAQYVSKVRGRLSIESAPPEVEVTGEAETVPEFPTIDEEPEPEPSSESFEVPPSEPEKPEQPSLFNGKQIVKVGFDGIAAFAGWEGWKLDPKDDTDAQFIEASDRMITKYGPGFIEKWGDEVMFVISAGTTVGPRIRDYKKHLDAQKTATSAPKIKKTPEETKILPAEATSPNPTENPSALDEKPRSVGDEKLRARIGGKLS